MLDEIFDLQARLGISRGHLLEMARVAAQTDTLRTIDLLTTAERETLLSGLRQIEAAEKELDALAMVRV